MNSVIIEVAVAFVVQLGALIYSYGVLSGQTAALKEEVQYLRKRFDEHIVGEAKNEN
jgi:hypothetical protein